VSMRPPFRYYGSKTSTAARIIAMMPPHDHYVEPFAGSLAVLLAKPPSRMETVNDLDRDLMTFWRILRDQPDELARVAALTPHSRAEYESITEFDSAPTDLERARRVWVRLSQSRGNNVLGTGWKRAIVQSGSGNRCIADMETFVGRILPAAERLRCVTLECSPALDIIRDYGAEPSVLLYVDPPYVASSRNSTGYRHEMGRDDQHAELADALRSARAAVVLSGYPSPLYQQLYNGWNMTTISAHSGNGVETQDRTEALWCNRPFANHLFTADTLAGIA
jgi:DNA adenine methylase